MNSIKLPDLAGFGLYQYQKRWILDSSRFKIGLWARQTGKDFSAAAEAVCDSLLHPGTTWIVLAAGERQALESIAKAKDWAGAFNLLVDDYCEMSDGLGTTGRRGGGQALLRAAEIRWSNGSRFVALPAKPETVRGYSANVILTEFAFHDDPEAIWRAIYPSISNPLRGGEKKLRIISTPNGLGNKFAELWHNGSEYSRHFTNIYDAINAGLVLDIEQLKRGLNDSEAWAQEYECQFTDRTSVLLPYQLIESCESAESSETGPGALRTGPGRSSLYLGIDFGRREHLTVAWTLEWPHPVTGTQPAPANTREVLCLKDLSTPEQIELLRPRVQAARRVAVDYTGPGIGLGDYLVKEFGEYRGSGSASPSRQGKIELCQFTPALKSELFPRMRTAFEKREIRIPISRAIREDLHGIHRIVSPSGNISYRASYSADGHSDRATALALALHASRNPILPSWATTISVPGRTADLRWALRRRTVI